VGVSAAGGRRPVGVAVAGFGWMGRAHTQAYARVLHHFPELAVAPELIAVADEVPGRAEQAAAQFGFAAATRDWRELVADPSVQAVSITAPNFLHREIGVTMAQAGKHIWIEKPVGLTTDDAGAVADAVRQAGVQGAVGFNYRNAPAVAAARELVAGGQLGPVTHARFRLFSDYAAHPEGALTWRYERARGGSGVLGDLAGGELGPVENEDYVSSLLRMVSGARVVLEASRVAVGEQNNYGFEIHGTRGAVSWDFRRMNELAVSLGDAYQDQPVSTTYVGPGHGHFAAFQPGAAVAMGFDDLKVIEAWNFLRSIAEGTAHGATVADAVRSAASLDAMAKAAETGTWVKVPAP
jgi:predicted dehydrogenase